MLSAFLSFRFLSITFFLLQHPKFVLKNAQHFISFCHFHFSATRILTLFLPLPNTFTHCSISIFLSKTRVSSFSKYVHLLPLVKLSYWKWLSIMKIIDLVLLQFYYYSICVPTMHIQMKPSAIFILWAGRPIEKDHIAFVPTLIRFLNIS